MSTKRIVVVAICGLLALAGISSAEGEELKGHSTWAPESVSQMRLADGRTIERQHLKGFAMTDNPDSVFNNISQDCMFTVVTSADGSSVSSGGFCDGIDADGDVYWAWGHATDTSGKWYYMGGTGKFEGLEGGGTYQLAGQWPDGKVLATWDGTANMK